MKAFFPVTVSILLVALAGGAAEVVVPASVGADATRAVQSAIDAVRAADRS